MYIHVCRYLTQMKYYALMSLCKLYLFRTAYGEERRVEGERRAVVLKSARHFFFRVQQSRPLHRCLFTPIRF